MKRTGRVDSSVSARCAVGLLLVCCRGAVADDQLETLCVAHRSARQAIHTFSANVTGENTVPTKVLVAEGTYWRSHDIVRIQQRLKSGDTSDFLVKDFEIRQVGTTAKDKAGRQEYMARRSPKSDILGQCDVWTQMLINFYGPDGGQFDLDRFLGFAKQPPEIKRERLGGVECVRLSMSIKGPGRGETRYIVWHDVTRNYLVRKIEMRFTDSASRIEAENVEFTEFPGGIFMPIRCVRRSHDGDQYSECITSLTDVRINEPIPKQVFELPVIPSGTSLDDRIQGTKYAVNSQWQRIGPEEPLRTLRIAAPSAEEMEYRSQSTREPSTASRWVIGAALVLLASAGIVWILRRNRRRQAVEWH